MLVDKGGNIGLSVGEDGDTHLMNSQNVTFFSAPDVVVIEIDEQGIGINLDYLSIVKPDNNPLNQIFNIP